ncbi:hypothetical protein E2C01_032206 [Portunus trituberculatus]|uniref:Uncharacterized protein n=1 Tax=Portunus trituberculatus TaxID=210409 RepID=A0A5B7EZ29_PORTR|nr:hypothetical protein [Portunus trituberculatus]
MQPTQTSTPSKMPSNNIKNLIEDLKEIWIYFNASYFSSLAASIARRIQSVLKSKGNKSKYNTVSARVIREGAAQGSRGDNVIHTTPPRHSQY